MKTKIFVLITLLLSFFSSPLVLAGGDMSPKQERKYNRQCRKGISGDACVALAEQTLCGRGYNKETEVFMKKACRNYSKNCRRGKAAACEKSALCIYQCTSMDIQEISVTDGTAGCAIPLSGKTQEIKNRRGLKKSLKLFKKACKKGRSESCFSAAEILKHDKKPKLKSIKKYMERACKLNNSRGCLGLVSILEKEVQSTKKKACELGEKKACSAQNP